jgi:hypothetical protein
LLVAVSLLGYDDLEVMLKIQAKIAPRIVLMSKINDHLTSGTIHIVIVYDDPEKKEYAIKLKEQMLYNYPNGLSKRALNISLIQADAFASAPKGSLVFLCQISAQKIEKIVKLTQHQGVITMAFSEVAMASGVMASLHVSRYVKPILNVAAAHDANITFDPTLLSISKIYKLKEPQ